LQSTQETIMHCGHRVHRRAADHDGWTLIELLIVISIIVVLAAITLAIYRNSVTAAQEAVLKEDLFRMRDAIDQYYADKGEYPASLDALVSESYLREIPVDPFTRSRDTWQTVLAEPDPNNPTATIGVYDVKSGSDATALGGAKYSEW
jgi:general secretion pathway protein G